jgi:hypothetical protein
MDLNLGFHPIGLEPCGMRYQQTAGAKQSLYDRARSCDSMPLLETAFTIFSLVSGKQTDTGMPPWQVLDARMTN